MPLLLLLLLLHLLLLLLLLLLLWHLQLIILLLLLLLLLLPLFNLLILLLLLHSDLVCVLQAARCARPLSTWCSRKLVSRCPPTPVPPAAMKCAPAAPVAAWRTAWRCPAWTPASTETQDRGRVSKNPAGAHRLGGKSVTVSV